MNKIILALFILVLVIASFLGFFYLQSSTSNFKIPILSNPLEIASSLQKLFPKNITVVSEIPSLKVAFNNKETLLSEMDKLSFWRKEGVGVNDGNSIKWTTAKNLKIVTSSQEQPWGGIYSSDGQKKTSFDFAVSDKGDTILTIWLNSTLDITDEDKGFLLSSALLAAIHDVTLWSNQGNPDSTYFAYLNGVGERIISGELKFPILIVKTE